MSDTDLITNLRLLIDHNILSGPETEHALDYIERVNEPDLTPEDSDYGVCSDSSPSDERRELAEEILHRDFTYLIDIQKNLK